MDWFQQIIHSSLFSINGAQVTPITLILAVSVFTLGFWFGSHGRRLMHSLFQERLNVPRSTAFAISTIVFYLVIIGSVMTSLSIIGFDLRNLAIIAGALSVGIGLGLQAIANNFMSGLLLLFDRSIRVGDYIEINDDLRGHIEEIRLRSTIIKTNDNVEVIIPNSEFISEQVINWTLTDAYKRMHIPFSVAYGSNVDRLFEAVPALAKKLPKVVLNIDDFQPQLWFIRMGESSLDFELIVWVERDAAVRPRGTTSIYLREIHRFLLAEEFEIPFPQHDVHIRSVNALPSNIRAE